MRKLVLVLAAIAGFGTTGCITFGHFTKSNVTQVDLAGNNFHVVKSNIQGSDTGTRIVGLGESPSHAKAMAALRKKAGLDGTRRALVNITEETHIFTLLVYTETTLTLTADVVEFTEAGAPMTTSAAETTSEESGSSTEMASSTESAFTTESSGSGSSGSMSSSSTSSSSSSTESSGGAFANPNEPASAESMLRQYVARHNLGRETGSFADLAQLFTEDGKIVFHGAYEGTVNGRDAIKEAFEKHPPKDSLTLIEVHPTRRGALGTYAYQGAPEVKVGKVAVRLADDKIKQLDIQLDKR